MTVEDWTVEVHEVHKSYDNTPALTGISLQVPQGKIVGLAGPNGAGKTTLVKVLLGVTKFDSGEVRVFGLDPSESAAEIRRNCSIVHQRSGVDPFLTVWDNIEIYLRLRGASIIQGEKRALELLDSFGLVKLKARPMISLSGGESRKVQLVRALLLQPRLLVMDEPTVNVDPVSRRVLWSLVRDLASTGSSILWTTHDLYEMEAVSDFAFIIKAGKVLKEGSPRALSRVFGGDVIEVSGSFPDKAQLAVTDQTFARLLHRDSFKVSFETDDADGSLAKVVTVLGESGATINRVTVRSLTFEEAFLRITKEGE